MMHPADAEETRTDMRLTEVLAATEAKKYRLRCSRPRRIWTHDGRSIVVGPRD